MSRHCQGKLNKLHVTTGKHEPVSNEVLAHPPCCLAAFPWGGGRPCTPLLVPCPMPGSVPPSWPRAPCPALWLIHDIGGGLCTLAMAVPCPPLYPTLPCEDHVPRGTAEPCCPEKGAVPVPGVSAPPPATLMGFPAGGGAGFPWKPSHPPAPTPAGPGNAAGGPLPAAPPPSVGVTEPGPPIPTPAGSGLRPRLCAGAQRAAGLIRGSV